MQKSFDTWNNQKKQIHISSVNKFYHEREIWWCSLGKNIGFEQDGNDSRYLRPVIILKGLGPKTCLSIPITSSPQKHSMRIPIGIVKGKQASAVISQLRVIDTKRLVEKVGFLEKNLFNKTKEAIKAML